MNRRLFWLIIFAGIVVLLLWLNRHRSGEQEVVQPLAVDTNQATPAPTRIGQRTNPAVVREGSIGLNPETNFGEWNSNRMKQMEAVSQDIKNEWRTPIQFYGKVVDENTNPVAGAQVAFSCNNLSETGTSNYKTTSDNQGVFSIQGISGKLLTVNVTKEDYYSSKQDNDSFYYAGQNVNFTPDIYNPVVFHLRKKGKGESLITVNYPGFAHIAQLHRDGTPIELDLFNGTQVSAGTGQLKLEFWKNSPASNSRNFDWKLQLSTPGGGLVPTDEEFDFQSPENGYRPSIVIDMPATNQNWQAELNAKFYIRLSNGDYGRIEFYLLPRNGAFTVQSAINPDGSGNLESQ